VLENRVYKLQGSEGVTMAMKQDSNAITSLLLQLNNL